MPQIGYSIIKPTLKTPYHIDFEWWKQNERNWQIILLGYLSPEHRQVLQEMSQEQKFDIIDPQTAEVRQVDALQHLLMTDYSKREDFISETTSLVEAIFRLFLVNGNHPMSSEEISGKLDRPAPLILQMLSGKRVHQGLRPYRHG
ncbi:MAG: hypothetical protein WCI88_03845 [Chloroflexota bacterium]